MSIIPTAIRKARQFAGDPTLRRWLWARALGRAAAPESFTPHRPPYLAGMPASEVAPQGSFIGRAFTYPAKSLWLDLPGARVEVSPGQPESLFEREYADAETLLAAHRFTWIPLLGRSCDPDWTIALWQAWRSRFANPDGSWAWHPYTAAERAVNLLGFFRQHGFPDPASETANLLATHAHVIAQKLEYFGESGTGNHLANNGRGLLALGLELGMQAYADMGAKIMIEEAKRIFAPSGVLREGSSHYHLLYARNYIEAWLWTRRHGHGAAGALRAVAVRALSVIPRLCLAGGLPLVGDISPDCPPVHLSVFLPGDSATKGWGKLLDDDERVAFLSLKSAAAPANEAMLAADGWLRFDTGEWSGLWHASPGGWTAMPGHGHEDMGGFEIHWRGLPLFVDTGRGAYGDTGEAALYRSARAHNGITLDGADPYPPNKPYYDAAFRRREGGPIPALVRHDNGVELSFGGYGRLGVQEVRRRWTLSCGKFVVEDAIAGRNRRTVARRMHTPWPCAIEHGRALIRTPHGVLSVSAGEVPPRLNPVRCWSAYGSGTQGCAIVFEQRASLPWSGILRVEAADA